MRCSLLGFLALAACASEHGDSRIADDFGLAFSPMYTAVDGEHEFRVPILAEDVPVDFWEVVDAAGDPQPSAAEVHADDQLPGGYQGAMLTARAHGDYFVLAHVGEQTGCAELHISRGTQARWELGRQSYLDAGCGDCHGKSVHEYTPEQLAGYSDAELAKLVTQGIVPRESAESVSGWCKPSTRESVRRLDEEFMASHRAHLDRDAAAALVLYLRSIAPASVSDVGPGPIRRRK